MLSLHLIVAALFGWLEREQRDVIEFLQEKNRVLRAQLHGRRMRLNDDERRRLAVIGQRLGRRILAEGATIVTPDTILRWHREFFAEVDLRRVAARAIWRAGGDTPSCASDGTRESSWGYTRIQGALKNLGHRVARSTIAKILKEQGYSAEP